MKGDTMVKRVARAIWRQEVDSRQHDEPFVFSWYEAAARAAIEAMRIPDAKMLKAACAAMSPGKRPTPKRVTERAKHGIRYRAMIDAALLLAREPGDRISPRATAPHAPECSSGETSKSLISHPQAMAVGG